ncbi:protein-glutamate methylesterase/protein-glutamine glutaminase [Cohnella caldifontis]|uniref:protein-glutamate methylesterase/protein-glutamine glutaminase n=1 Tax=Cohnella caldifontis TaxID=3027471 RepID=UPI0023EB0149|nr:chemotaxis protein CheB [Cohnella sp. YIM B05605]
MTVYRVLIVDDSRFMRHVLSDMVNADDAFTVASTASDGEEAVRLALELTPDIITMDMEMPRMNGLEALQRIMAARPTPVIMLSAVTDNGARDTIKALQYGAFDFVRKPDRAVNLDIGEVSRYLLEKLHIAAESLRAGTLRMLPAVQEAAETEAEGKKHGADPPATGGQAPDYGSASPPSQDDASEQRLKGEGGKPPGNAGPIPPKPNAAAIERPATAGRPPAPRKPQPANTGLAPSKPRQADQAKPPVASKPAAPSEGSTRRSAAGLKKSGAAPPLNRDLPAGRSAGSGGKIRGTSAFRQIVAVGTSTGGPRALHELLTALPADLEAPVLVVQHMPPKFTHSLAQRLNAFCNIRVCEAEHGTVVETGTAYIAPGGKQMALEKEASGTYRIKLSEDGPRSGHMPSVDVLFESLVGLRELTRHLVLMTGMGSDGASGMKALQMDGAEIRIAESAETCVVYGMPRSAVELGAASHVLPLQQIAPFLLREVRSRSITQSP